MENIPRKPLLFIYIVVLVLIWNYHGPGAAAVDLIGVLAIFLTISVYHARKKDLLMLISTVILGLITLLKIM